MKWFEHRHHWYPHSSAEFSKIMQPGTDRALSALIVEHCRCGAVRTIEFKPGETPVVRVAKMEGSA